MKIAVISDIHGNLEALTQVLADIERTGCDTAVSLGDNVGYGADPEEVTRLIRSMGIPSVMGNHELGLTRPEYLSRFNESARDSVILTGRLISEESRKWLGGLPSSLILHDALFVHGAPPDSIFDYIFELDDYRLVQHFEKARQRICFVGHTHTLELISIEEGRVLHFEPGCEVLGLAETASHIVNAGSVGQPRDGNNNAKYVIWDKAANILEIRFVPYDIASAAKKISSRGFASINATRLW